MSRIATVVIASLLLAACSKDKPEPDAVPKVPAPKTSAATMTLRSSAFDEGSPIPAAFTCDGEGKLPPLEWVGVPDEATELALIVTDIDAPDPGYLHLAAFGLDSQRQRLDGSLPAGARLVNNSGGKPEWAPPCPPPDGGRHRYQFDLLALDEPTSIEQGATPGEVEKGYRDKIVASARLTGTVDR